MFGMKVSTFYRWYKNYISDYIKDTESGRWCSEHVEDMDIETGEVTEKPIYVLKPENLGEKMSIDDKAVGHDGFTILSNSDTGKIAMMLESTRAKEVEQALEKFGTDLQKIKHVSMDMSPTYAMVFNDSVP